LLGEEPTAVEKFGWGLSSARDGVNERDVVVVARAAVSSAGFLMS